MANFNLWRFLVLLTALISIQSVKADWVNLTGAEISRNIAEIYIRDDHVKVKLEVFLGDISAFADLIPDDWVTDPDIDHPSLEERTRHFANHALRFITGKGEVLPAQFLIVEPRLRVDRRSPYAGKINPYNLRRLPEAPVDKRVLYAEIIYPFDKKPDRLTIIPPLDDRGDAEVNIGFIAYHQTVPVTDFRYLGQPEVLNLNWQDPWYTRFENKNLTRHHRYPLMLFLYVEPRQVRLESIMRVVDVKDMTGFDDDNAQANRSDRHQRLQRHIINYHAQQDSLRIDGDMYKPDSVRVEFLNISLTGIKVIENVSTVAESSLLVGVSQQFYVPALPNKVETDWQYFNQRIDRIPVTATDPVGPLSSFIDMDDPVLVWKNFLKEYSEPAIQPVAVETGWNISLPYIGKVNLLNQLPDQQQALEIVGGVLENLRVSFVEKEPASFSRVLGEVISSSNPGLLEKELAKLFSPKVSGGSVGAVQAFNDFQIVSIRELNNPAGFSVTVGGTANISAQHWGHIDKRQINFQLLLDLVKSNNQWRLADLTVIDIKEVK